jgi:hypothetical protein
MVVVMNWLLKFHISTISTCHNHYNHVSSTMYSFTREGVSYPFSKPHLHPRFLCLFYVILFDWCCFVDLICDFFPLYFSICE